MKTKWVIAALGVLVAFGLLLAVTDFFGRTKPQKQAVAENTTTSVQVAQKTVNKTDDPTTGVARVADESASTIENSTTSESTTSLPTESTTTPTTTTTISTTSTKQTTEPAPVESVPKTRPRVLIFGDSITAISSEALQDQFQKAGYQVTVDGVSHAAAFERVDAAKKRYLENYDIVVLNLGTNDVARSLCGFDGSCEAVDISVGQKAYQDMLDMFHRKSCVIGVTLWFGQEALDKIFETNLANRHLNGIADWRSKLQTQVNGETNNWLLDWTHPNVEGQTKLAELLVSTVQQKCPTT